MPKQVKEEKTSQKREEEPVAEMPAKTEAEIKAEETAAMLDEIDEVLEVNAEEFVKAFVQKGGE
jgi:ubiquitin-like protein Pup